MAKVHEVTFGALAPLVGGDIAGLVSYNEEHVVRIKRHVIRMLRARPEDDPTDLALLAGHIWDAARVVANAWGYIPSVGSQAMALRELTLERLATEEHGAWPPNRFRGSNRKALGGFLARLGEVD